MERLVKDREAAVDHAEKMRARSKEMRKLYEDATETCFACEGTGETGPDQACSACDSSARVPRGAERLRDAEASLAGRGLRVFRATFAGRDQAIVFAQTKGAALRMARRETDFAPVEVVELPTDSPRVVLLGDGDW